MIGKVQLGREAIEKAKQSILWLRAHLDEPNHVPADSVHGIREQLTKLEKRVAELEEQLSSRRA